MGARKGRECGGEDGGHGARVEGEERESVARVVGWQGVQRRERVRGLRARGEGAGGACSEDRGRVWGEYLG